jgi:hypothetical protein
MAENRKIPCKFPWNRELANGDGFAVDCPHRHYLPETVADFADARLSIRSRFMM